MKWAPRQWLRTLHDKLPEPRVLLAPGHLFFSKQLSLDPAMTEEEIDDFVTLSIEGLSPFPVEQLTWGYLKPENCTEALLYATPIARLATQTENDLSSYFHVFPSFVAGLRQEPAPAPTIHFIATHLSLTALYFETGKHLPSKVVSRPLPSSDLSDKALLQARDTLARKIEPGPSKIEEGLHFIEGFFVGHQNQVYSRHRLIREGTTSQTVERPVDLTERQLHAADVRETTLTDKNLRNRQLARKLWGGLQVIAACFLLLLLLQFTVWGLRTFTEVINERFVERERIVDQVLQREDFIRRLSLDSLQSADPTLMLAVINNTRPDSIYFTEASAKSIDTITVKGISQVGADRVNLYEEALKELPYVLDAETIPSTKDSQTSFDLTVTFDVALLAAEAERVQTSLAPSDEDLADGELLEENAL